jgi:hypothetical protein
VAGVSDKDDFVVRPREAQSLDVDLGDEGAGGVDDAKPTLSGRLADGRRDAVGTKHKERALRYLRRILHEHGALGPQRFHDVSVMDNLVAHVDGGAEALEGLFDDLNRPVDARAEATGAREEDAHGAQSSRAGPPERG